MVRSEFQKRLNQIAAEDTSTVNILTLMLIEEPLASVDLTNKNTLSFNVMLERRTADIVELSENRASSRILRLKVGASE